MLPWASYYRRLPLWQMAIWPMDSHQQAGRSPCCTTQVEKARARRDRVGQIFQLLARSRHQRRTRRPLDHPPVARADARRLLPAMLGVVAKRAPHPRDRNPEQAAVVSNFLVHRMAAPETGSVSQCGGAGDNVECAARPLTRPPAKCRLSLLGFESFNGNQCRPSPFHRRPADTPRKGRNCCWRCSLRSPLIRPVR